MLEEGLATSILDAMEQPLEQAMRILEKRQYAWAKDEINRPDVKLDQLPDTPMIKLAQEIEADIVLERVQEMRRSKPKKPKKTK